MEYLTAYCTDQGISRPGNQDSILIQTAKSRAGNLAFAAVCDGMGGLEKGELASAYVLRELAGWFEHQLPYLLLDGFREELLQLQWTHLLQNCSRALMGYGIQEGIQLGTTCTAMLFLENHFYLMHVGDSRAYEIERNAVKLTVDQVLAGSPHVLLQCVGASLLVKPDFYQGICRENMYYLLCSDGFYHCQSDQEIAGQVLALGDSPEDAMEAVLLQMTEQNKRRREKDNISSVLIKCTGEAGQ